MAAALSSSSTHSFYFSNSSSSSSSSSSSPSFSISSGSQSGYSRSIKLPSISRRGANKILYIGNARTTLISNVAHMQDGAVTSKLNSSSTAKKENAVVEKIKEKLNSNSSSEELNDGLSFDLRKDESTVSITVVGASGDLAKKKIFPALFALFYEDCLPKHFTVFGYARSKMSDEELRNMVSKTLTCRIDKRENCSEKMEQFLQRCFYHSGHYDSQDNFADLDLKLRQHEAGRVSNRLFYLSIPPNIFIDAVRCASSSASSASGWTRVIVEKPFGRDSGSSAALTTGLKKYLHEDQIFSGAGGAGERDWQTTSIIPTAAAIIYLHPQKDQQQRP